MSTRPEDFHEPDPRPREPLVRVRRDGQRIPATRALANEIRLELFIDGARLLAFNCSQTRLPEMVLGYLWLEQIIDGVDDVTSLRICLDDRLIEVTLARPLDRAAYEKRRAVTSGCGGGVTFADLMEVRNMTPVTGGPTLAADRLFDLIAQLFQGSAWYRASGGMHGAALADAEDGLLMVCEDLGRHNTIDKIAGACLLQGIDPSGRILLTTGRMSSDMVIKAARMRTPILVSRTSPTDLSVSLARELGLTLVGYVRGPDCYVYTAPERVATRAADSSVARPVTVDEVE